jgi:predicted alpha/beta superfamily hydrolase
MADHMKSKPNVRPDFTRNSERKKLEERLEEAGYKPENGYGDDFIDSMIEIFKPWMESEVRGPRKARRS